LILLDTSGLIAALDESERLHVAARDALLEQTSGALALLSPFVLAETDYLLTRNLGSTFSLSLAAQVADGAYELAKIDRHDVGEAVRVLRRYADLEVGLTDASIVVLADRYGTDRVLTLDERHFRALRTLDGRPFTLLPADA
jgi:uncharacterized protein